MGNFHHRVRPRTRPYRPPGCGHDGSRHEGPTSSVGAETRRGTEAPDPAE